MKKSKPKVKEKKQDEENFDYMKTNKDNIKNVLKDPNILPIINDLVNRTNKIVIHAYQFIKLYCIFLYENELKFPVIDKKFICDVPALSKTLCNDKHDISTILTSFGKVKLFQLSFDASNCSDVCPSFNKNEKKLPTNNGDMNSTIPLAGDLAPPLVK